MSKIALSGNASGTGTFTIASPNSNSDRTLNLPDSAGTLATAESTLVQFNASGSAPVYACRAWVNFNGTGTVAIRASGNVSSITDNGTGDYRVNFTTAMPDTNYAAVFGNAWSSVRDSGTNGAATTYLDVVTGFTSNTSGGGTGADASAVQIAIFR
jgi:hypothetical protein